MSENHSIWPFKLLRHPINTDWIFWLWLVSLFASLLAVTNSLSSDASSNINPLAGLIDFIFAIVIQTLIFLVIPAQIRKSTSDSGRASQQGTSLILPMQNYEFELTEEMRVFLDSLEIVKGRLDGWYRDPSSLFKLRYFYRGRWTLATSDSDSESDKSVALSKLLTVTKKTPIHQNGSMKPPNSRQEEIVETQVVKQLEQGNIVSDLEKLAALLDRGLLSDEEFRKAKHQLLNS